MSKELLSPTEQKVRKSANDILSYTFFHLVSELRKVGIQETPTKMPSHVKDILISALFGAVLELMHILEDYSWFSDWEDSSHDWALQSVYGENGIEEVKAYFERIKSNKDEFAEFKLCGIYAARNLIEYVCNGGKYDDWLENYEGMFAAMTRFFKVI